MEQKKRRMRAFRFSAKSYLDATLHGNICSDAGNWAERREPSDAGLVRRLLRRAMDIPGICDSHLLVLASPGSSRTLRLGAYGQHFWMYLGALYDCEYSDQCALS